MRERQNERQREKKEEIVRQKLTEGRGRQKVGWSTSEREKQKETERGRWEKMDTVKEIQRQKQGNTGVRERLREKGGGQRHPESPGRAMERARVPDEATGAVGEGPGEGGCVV